MDKFVGYYWSRIWLLNVFLILLVLWGVLDTIYLKYSVSWLYFTLFVFLMFVLAVRNDAEKRFVEREKLLKEGLIE